LLKEKAFMTITGGMLGRASMRWGALLFVLALVTALLVSVVLGTSSASDNGAGKTVVVPVAGMSCVSCAAAIKRTVKDLNGVSEVEVSLAARTMRVTYTPDVISPDRIVAAVNALGYQAGKPVTEE